jgi:hypothetical protein
MHKRSFGWISIKIHNEIKCLKVLTYDPPHALSLREINKRIFIAVTPACLAIALLHVYLVENPTYNAGTFGWVQTGFASEWSERIGPNNQAKTLQDLKFPLIPPAVMQKLSVNEMDSGTVHINEKDTDKVFILNVVGGSQTPKEKKFVPLFLTFGLGTQILFVAFMTWFAVKIILIFIWIIAGVRRNLAQAKPGRVIRLRFNDELKRLGLRAFDRLYDFSLGLVCLGSGIIIAQMIQNQAKGAAHGSTLLGLFMTAVLTWGLFVVIIAMPCGVLLRYCSLVKDKECTRLNIAIREEESKPRPDAGAIDRLSKQRALASVQTPWPKGDTAFKVLVAMITVLLGVWLVPTIAFNIPLIKDYAKLAMDVVQSLTSILCTSK